MHGFAVSSVETLKLIQESQRKTNTDSQSATGTSIICLSMIIQTISFKSYNSLHKFDIICLFETYLDSNTPLHDDNLEISGYTIVRSDHPSNTKRGGAYLYHKNKLPLRVINIGYLNEYQTLELKKLLIKVATL